MEEEITVKASLACLDTVNGFVEDLLSKWECPMKLIMKILVSVEEIFVNVANYAYEGADGDCTIKLKFSQNNEAQVQNIVKIQVIDAGVQFNPLAKEDPDITLSADQRQIGGLGIFMAKNIMDKISYKYEEQKNMLFMEKTW